MEQKTSDKILEVNKDLDVLFGGGLQPGNITHLYGVPASGKTNIALMATAAGAEKGKVVYIDCEGGFSTERLKQICGERFMKTLKNILLVEPTDFDEQKIAVKRLTDILSSSDVSLIVVDSISVFYRLETERNTKELGKQISALLRIARKYEVPVLMLNQVYTNIDSGKIVPVGGDITRYWSKIMIELQREQGAETKTAILRKHKFLPEGIQLRFKITQEGIKSLGIKYPMCVINVGAMTD